MRSINYALAGFLSIAALIASTGSQSQGLPRQVSFVVPFAAGGSTDALARLAGARLTAQTGAVVIVENRPGAGGYTGAEYVARAPADGSILLVSALESLYSDIFTKNLALRPVQSLVPIVGIGHSPHIIVAPATLPIKNMKEFITHVKANPGKYNAGVVTNNAVMLEALLFLKQNGLELQPIPYNGGLAAITGMLRGEIHFYMGSVSVTKAHIDAGKILALGIAGSERFPLVPQVPTNLEQGIDFEGGAYYGLAGPLKLPAAVIAQLNKMLVASPDNTANREALAKIGYLPTPPVTPEALMDRMQKQHKHFLDAAAAAGVQPQ